MVFHGNINHEKRASRLMKLYKAIVFITVTILPLGILAHSALLLLYNKLFPVASRTVELLIDFWNLRHIAEMSARICTALFIFTYIVMIYLTIKNVHIVPIRKMVLHFLLDLIAMFTFAVTFAMIDDSLTYFSNINRFADYLFPVWSNLIILALFFAVLVLVNIVKLRRIVYVRKE